MPIIYNDEDHLVSAVGNIHHLREQYMRIVKPSKPLNPLKPSEDGFMLVEDMITIFKSKDYETSNSIPWGIGKCIGVRLREKV